MSDEETEFIYQETDVEVLKKKISESRYIIKQADDDKKGLQEQNKELVVQISRLNELLELKHKQVQSSQQEVIKLREQLDDRELKLVKSMKEKQQLQNEIISQNEIVNQFIQKEDNLNSEIYAIRITMEQLQQANTIQKQEMGQLTTKDVRTKDQIEQLVKTNKQLDEQLKRIQQDHNQKIHAIQQELINKTQQLEENKKQAAQQQKQTEDIITELIEQKNINLSNSTFGRQDVKPELAKLTKENEEMKHKLNDITTKFGNAQLQLQQYNSQVAQLSLKFQEQNKVFEVLTEQVNSKDGELKRMVLERGDFEIMIDNLRSQIQLLKEQEQLMSKQSLSKSSSTNDDKLSREIKQKNEQIAMLQNENNQLVKLIEALKIQKIDVQGSDAQRVKHLESELKNLQAFIYESPLVVIFNLLEDRLSKQQTKSQGHKNNLKEYWVKQLKLWEEGLEELRQAFGGLKILFKYDIKYNA